MGSDGTCCGSMNASSSWRTRSMLLSRNSAKDVAAISLTTSVGNSFLDRDWPEGENRFQRYHSTWRALAFASRSVVGRRSPTFAFGRELFHMKKHRPPSGIFV